LRNDARLEVALARLPRGSGFVFRHYHLDEAARQVRFTTLAEVARTQGHLVIWSGTGEEAHRLGADGAYGAADRLGQSHALPRLATAHDGDELQLAIAIGADGIFLSPVFPTQSHPQAATLGVHGFHVLAQQSPVPVIALGGMTAARAEELAWPRWGAIDGLT
jgi:thiamine-phosphate pyrophosphorylase